MYTSEKKYKKTTHIYLLTGIFHLQFIPHVHSNPLQLNIEIFKNITSVFSFEVKHTSLYSWTGPPPSPIPCMPPLLSGLSFFFSSYVTFFSRSLRLSSFTLYHSPVAVVLSEGQTFISVRPGCHIISVRVCVRVSSCGLEGPCFWPVGERGGGVRFKHTSCIFHETLIFNTTHTHTHTPAYIRHCSTRQGFSPSSSSIHLREYNSSTLYQCQVASRVFPAGVFRALKSSSSGGLEPAVTLWT